MDVHTTVADFKAARRRGSGSLGLVPTMGYLHRGHLALVRRARAENDLLAVSIFVNPAQFGPSEDYEAYPRDMDRDLELLRQEGVDYVFAPGVEEVYAPGHDTWVDTGELAARLEGEHRPGHFRGVATVVAKLFNIVGPRRAYFGQKDGQQVAVIRRMVSQLDMGVDIVAVPTVREEDGLALSSRNVYLTPEQRGAAPAIFRALLAAEGLWMNGEREGDALRRAVRRVLDETPLIEAVDYVSVAGTEGLAELDRVTGPAMVSVAVRMGRARLIDNLVLDPGRLSASP
jgi:pantoate--beta-alanine ligase